MMTLVIRTDLVMGERVGRVKKKEVIIIIIIEKDEEEKERGETTFLGV